MEGAALCAPLDFTFTLTLTLTPTRTRCCAPCSFSCATTVVMHRAQATLGVLMAHGIGLDALVAGWRLSLT